MDGNVPSRYDWDIYGQKLEFENMNLEKFFKLYVMKTLNKTQQIFDYDGLPETIPKRCLELILQRFGYAIITKVDGKLYAFYGGLGGVPDAYYEPTNAIVNNPFLNYSATLKIGEDCVLMRNDSVKLGLMPLIERYAYLQSQTDVSFKFMCVNSRVGYILNAKNDIEKETAEKFLEDVEKGEKLGIVESGYDSEGLNVYNNTLTPNLIQHLVELRQYNEGTFLQEIGIQSAFNMKREAINEAESTLSTDILFPLIDDMLEQRQLALDAINDKYGTNITVKISSVWAHTRTDRMLQEKKLENDANVDKGNEEQKSEDTETEVQREDVGENGEEK